MPKEKLNLLGFSHESLVEFFDSIKQPKFRASQLMKWIHQRGVLNFMEMTDFSLELSDQLNDLAIAEHPEVADCLLYPKWTKAYIIKLSSGTLI